MQKHVQTKSLGSRLPLQRSKSSCAIYNGNSIGLNGHAFICTTSFTSRKKSESFLDWFSCRTNSDSWGYASSRQEDILQAFSRKTKVDARLKDQETMK